MIHAHGQNLIFLLSVPRSGSSLTTVMLQNHSKVFAAQEMWFLMSLHDLRCKEHRPYGGTAIINQFFKGVLTEELFEQACRQFALEVYNGLLAAGGAEMVVDKSPRYYYCLEFIDRLFPLSRRIWLVRNPLDVLASFKKVNRHVHDRFDLKEDLLAPGFNIKMADITIGLFRYADYFSAAHPCAYRLHYERLVARPEEQLRALCDFLGLDMERGMDKYGDFMDSSKSDMFFSMGVGDPFLGAHREPHRQSVGVWKERLDQREVEMYCRALGARIFRDLGYGEELEEAQRWTGASFDEEPDRDLLRLRTRQLEEASGCGWRPNYRLGAAAPALPAVPMRSAASCARPVMVEDRADAAVEAHAQPVRAEAQADAAAEALQLRITLRALERRLEKSCEELERCRKQYLGIRRKVNRVKAMVPFGRYISRWASGYLAEGGRKT